MKLIELSECLLVALANISQQILGLMFELVQVGTNWKTTGVLIRHTSLLMLCPLSALRAKEVRTGTWSRSSFRWTQSCPRTGGALHATQRIAAKRHKRHKNFHLCL